MSEYARSLEWREESEPDSVPCRRWEDVKVSGERFKVQPLYSAVLPQ